MKMNHEPVYFELHSDLSKFGLNPLEWRILAENRKTYRIESKKDRNFVFLGQTTRNGPRVQWKKLQLISL